jgi:regulator of CtrA degradation
VDHEIAQTAFFGKTFEEALVLVVEARDYVAGRLAFDRETVNLEQQLVVDCETLRLTSRLTHAMAWLMIQRAIHAGELTAEQAKQEENRLGGHEVCLFNEPDTLAQLPKRLQSLMTRSHALYLRVARLDEMIGPSAA